MVSHPWYVLRIPYTDMYLPPLTTLGLLFVLFIVVVIAVAASLSSKRRDENQ